jgi:hypothetical protein
MGGVNGQEVRCEDLASEQERHFCSCIEILAATGLEPGSSNCRFALPQEFRAQLNTVTCGYRLSLFLAPALEPAAGDHGNIPATVTSVTECSIKPAGCEASDANACVLADELELCSDRCQSLREAVEADPALVLWARIWTDER